MLGNAFTELYMWWFTEPIGAFFLVFGLMLLVSGAVIGSLSQ